MKNYTFLGNKYTYVLFTLLLTLMGFESYAQYCNSNGNTSYATGITRVIFNTIDHSDTNNTNAAYENFTAISTTVIRGNSYNLSTHVNTDGNYWVYARVWIDWNQDGDFVDAGEQYDLGRRQNVTNGLTDGSPLSITVPVGATLGNTRMRVAARYNAYPENSCSTGYDGEVEDYTINITTSSPQEINITGNGNTIADGDTTPSTTDGTDFGNAVFPGGSATSTFVIQNTGSANLNLTGASPYVVISGAHAGDFSLTTIPSTPITGGNNTSFAITFSPGALGLRTASISIANNDADENPYNFNIQGTGIVPPPCGSSVIGTTYSFESNAQGWTFEGSPVGDRGNYGSSSYDGNQSIRLRNTGAAISPAFSLAAYDKVDVKFFFRASGMDALEPFYIEYRENSSASWQTVATYRRINGASLNKDGDYVNNSFHSKTATLFKTGYSFPSAATAQFRIRNGANDNNDIIYIDMITITGTAYCTPASGPGGVTSHLDLWLQANKLDGSGVAANNAAVTKWTDTGKGNHAEAVANHMAPSYRHNVNSNFNFNPVIEFENNNNTAYADMTYLNTGRHELKGTGGFNSNDTFIVLMPDPAIPLTHSATEYPLDTFTSTDPTGTTYSEDVTGFGYGQYSARFIGERITYCIGTTNESSTDNPHPSYDNGYGRADIGSTTNYNQISIINFRHNASNSDMELYFNANNAGNLTNDIAKFAEIKNTRYWIGRSQYWNGSFDGRIAEVITYNSRKSDANLTQERNRIQSYLAIKYGITLGANGTSQDYVNSDGNVIWDVNTGVPANDAFNYNIAGIGRDDASGLHQKQSRSVNNATDGQGKIQGVLTMGITQIHATNNANPNTIPNGHFLVWGDDNTNLNTARPTIQVDMSADISGLTTMVEFTGIARTWKVMETGGDMPAVEVAVLRSAIRTATPPNGRYLMFIADTPNFGPTADYRVMTEDFNELGEQILKTNYDFDGTKYITFGWAPERVYDRSISFNGTTNYIDMEDNLNLNTSGFTVSAWLKRDINSTNKSILSKRGSDYNAAPQGYDLRINGSGHLNVRWKNSSGVSQELTSSVPIPLNVWHNAAVIYNGTTATLYIDGVADTTASLSAPATSTHSFLVGAAGKGTITDFFHGGIDEVRIWNTALTVDQLRFVMNQEIRENAGFVRGSYFEGLSINPTKNDIATVPWSQLAAYYPMTTYTYTNTKDESGNGIQGALRTLRTVDHQTAPLPYISNANGNWTTTTTWVNGAMQTIPGAPSIVNPSQTVDWNIVQTNHNITIDKDNVMGRHVSTLGLLVNSNTLTVDGSEADTGTGNALTVTHYLSLNGKIDLQGESQLIQTLGSDLNPASSGELDRDQQGTRDLFTYNYWSSPVGTKNTITNNNSYTVPTVLRDGTNEMNPQSITFLTSGYNGNTSPLRIADYWLWKFANQPDNDYSAWQHVRSTGTIGAGEGYTMKGVANTGGNVGLQQNYVFTGKPNNGNINLTINAGNDYLVGNPYASAIDAQQFILDNGPAGTGSINGTLYFWEHWGGGSHNLAQYQGGYAMYNLSGGTFTASYGTNDPNVGTGGTPTKLPGRYIAVSQGFFVVASPTGGTINFNNGQRAYRKESSGNTVFMRMAQGSESNNSTNTEDADTRMKFRFGFNSTNTIYRQLLLTIDENATETIDWGYDGKLYEDQMDDVYFMIENEKHIIQGRNPINENTIIPLGLHVTSAGQNTIKIDALENVPDSVDIYLHDKVPDLYHDLRLGGYTFNIPSGEYLNRFEITFATNKTMGVDDSIISSIDVFFNNTNESIVVLNPELKTIKTIELFNILGQSIQTFDDIAHSNNSEYKVKKLSTGTYIIKVYTDTGSFSKKVLVK